jgi:tetratricopeptide (TPR) repeat protein
MQEWKTAEVEYRRAIELSPHYPLAHEWISALLVGTGRLEEGTREILLAEELDPISIRPKVLSAWTMYQARNYSVALQKAREILAFDPSVMQGHLQEGNILLEVGEIQDAILACRRAAEIGNDSPLPLYPLAFALARSGDLAAARETANSLFELGKSRYVSPYFIALCFLAAGDRDAGFHWLEQAQLERSPWMLWLGTEPKLDPFRTDERYIRILTETNNPINRKRRLQ